MDKKWDLRFLKMATMVASWSKDQSTKVGCVITKKKKLRSVGYNGIPTGLNDDVPDRNERPKKYMWYSHAEFNALVNYPNKRVKGCTLYVTHFPCTTCARFIVESKIKRLVYITTKDESFLNRWKEEHDNSLEMFTEAGIIIESYSEEELS